MFDIHEEVRLAAGAFVKEDDFVRDDHSGLYSVELSDCFRFCFHPCSDCIIFLGVPLYVRVGGARSSEPTAGRAGGRGAGQHGDGSGHALCGAGAVDLCAGA